MDHGVIGIPFDLAMSSELSRRQFYGRAQTVLAERDQLRAEVKQCAVIAAQNASDAADLYAEVEALRGLLKECRPAVSAEVAKWKRVAATSGLHGGSIVSGLLLRIDAAMAAKEA